MLPLASSSQIPDRYVLDSYAILAFFGSEPSASIVRDLYSAAEAGRASLHLSVVNLGEVLYIEERERGLPHAQDVLAHIDQLPIEIVHIDRSLALSAAHLKAATPVAYADCFAAALSLARNAVLVTGDPEFARFDPGIGLRVKWLGNSAT